MPLNSSKNKQKSDTQEVDFRTFFSFCKESWTFVDRSLFDGSLFDGSLLNSLLDGSFFDPKKFIRLPECPHSGEPRKGRCTFEERSHYLKLSKLKVTRKLDEILKRMFVQLEKLKFRVWKSSLKFKHFAPFHLRLFEDASQVMEFGKLETVADLQCCPFLAIRSYPKDAPVFGYQTRRSRSVAAFAHLGLQS